MCIDATMRPLVLLGLTENVDPALRQTVHAGFDGGLVTHVQLLDLQGPAQGPARCLDQSLGLTQVPHGGVDCNSNNPSEAVALLSNSEVKLKSTTNDLQMWTIFMIFSDLVFLVSPVASAQQS